MEGPVRLNQCIEEGPSCERKTWCPAHQVWAEAQAAVVTVLGGVSMTKLAEQVKSSPARYGAHEKAVWISGVPQKKRDHAN
jgi:DNA-binding IscR family transcriptional regulator